MTKGTLLTEISTVNKDCRWCGDPNGVQRGQGKSRDFWFHANCFRAVNNFYGWDIELTPPPKRSTRS